MAADLSRGACAGMADATFGESDPFYPEPVRGWPTNVDPYAAAKAVCGRCAIRDQCLQDALTDIVQWGYRGGMTPEKRQELKTGPGKINRNKLTETEHIQRRAYYDQGWSDEMIAAAQHVLPATIKGWRFTHKLPSHAPTWRPHSPEIVAKKWALYRAGHNDREIGEAIGCGRKSIRTWRKREGLEPNSTRTKVTA
jgi:hypothetical protein